MKENSKHIGVIKFYDSRKGFGYIASNHCAMNSSVYEQDFYVDSSSFIEESAKTDRRLVVFQWEAQGRGKRRAINVRNYSSKSEEDLELALTYYGDYEFVQLKEQRINMFSHLGVKRPQMLPLLKRQIETSPGCVPKEICSKILHLVKKYKTDLPEDKRYIFTKDYDNENRPLWDEIFSLLKREEWVELLNTIPPVALYVTDHSIITEWLEGLAIDLSDSTKLKDLEYTKRYLSEDQISLMNSKIEETVNQHILSIIEENKKKSYLPTVGLGMMGRTRMEQSIREYIPYTSRNFDTEIAACKRQVKVNQFRELLDKYDATRYDSNSQLDSIIETFGSIDNSDELKQMILPLIEQKLNSFAESNSYPELSKLLNKIRRDFGETVDNTLVAIKDSVLEYLTESIDKCIQNSSQHDFEKNFESRYDKVNNFLTEDEIATFKTQCRDKILGCTCVDIIHYAYTSNYNWIEKVGAIRKIANIISAWDFKSIRSYISKSYGIDNIPKVIKRELALRVFDVLGKDLDNPFDGTPKEEYDDSWHSARRDNIDFLESVKKLCFEDELKSRWMNYVNSLSDKDILSLYYNKVISHLNDEILSHFVSGLTLEDTYNPSESWYSVPAFSNDNKKQVFTDTEIDIFNPIANHLKNLIIDKDNISLAVWFVELLAANKPGDDNYYVKREWENDFAQKVRNLKSVTEGNTRLSVLLWAVHLQTTTNKAAMAEIFPWLPPYLQIKIVKRLFQYIADGKMNFTAHSLYDFLTSSKENLCLPLEIVFSYLKLREDNPEANFTNAHMLSLLDGRNDHQEWIGIREFVEQCHGRWYAKYDRNDDSSDWHTPFYNGQISIIDSSGNLELFIPRKMINGNGSSQDYNNKYYTLVNSIIGLNFDNGTFTKKEDSKGTCYRFSDSNRIALLGLARQYNINITWDNSKLNFILNESIDDPFCECRLADNLSEPEKLPFYWCGNQKCLRSWVRFHTSSEWEKYTLLDFMRILNLPIDYVNRAGKIMKKGYFIIFSGWLKSFARFYEHLKCRKCGELMHPVGLSNFASGSITEFSCENPICDNRGFKVYLNHCFNRLKCSEIIDSRDSKQCPNRQYICPECGGCCSTDNFRNRIYNLTQTGGYISQWLQTFVNGNLGHWEKNEFYCYKCGKEMIPHNGDYVCPDCNVKYDKTSKK